MTLRDDFLLDPTVTFLNHGSFGATPRPVLDAQRRWQDEMERQPVEFLGRRFYNLLAQSRKNLADYLGTQPNNLVYVTNATTGVNIIAHSLNLGPGDEVLTTDHEYGACDRAWRFYAHRQGFKYTNQTVSLPVTDPLQFVDSFWQGVNSNTRVIYISHITSPTALIFPVDLICARARKAGIMTVVDGAHAPGQIPLSLDALGADFYTGNLHKWLCAPKGSAFLYARPEVQNLIHPLTVSWGWEAETPGPSPFIDYLEWTGTRDISAFLAVPDAIAYQESRQWPALRASCHELAAQTQQRITRLTGLAPLHPNDPVWFAQMASSPLPSHVNAAWLKEQLYSQFRVEVPIVTWNNRIFVRYSFQAYNTPDESDTLIRALELLIK
ncbi:MAG TPA: aminotransferase class V-fold PLP-dependent enzyme [Anaerolineaceae bacterium]|mgnify:CR=1 FL=1|nr:aminotransferase class V-fold PLP-dependent enzyme [Anaerolineaceae bacterium]HPN51157.1 aminotransferase class V-fold PLP-dependent enzyme [Anaerolineaceae bacterium]